MASMMTCRVHPVVILSIVDCHERRNSKQQKAIGTLLGWYDKQIMEVTSCYSVPFSEEKGEPEIDVSFNNDMYELHRKSGSEIPVGWFCTSAEVTEHSLNYHDYYGDFSRVKQEKRDTVPVLLLTVDASLKSKRMEIKAYLRTKAGIPGSKAPHCAIFIPLSLELAMYGPEETALDLITTGMNNNMRQANLATGLGQLHGKADEMLRWLDDIKGYVDAVLSGARPGDPVIGRRLMDLVTSVGKMQPKQFEDMINNSVKDYLMVFYLSQLAKTQLTLHEKMLTV